MKNNISIKVLTIIYKNNDILLLKEKISKNPDSRYNFVRGSYDIPGEKILEAAKRECREEVGIYNFSEFKLHSIREFYDIDKTRIYYIFIAHTQQDAIIPKEANQIKTNEEILSYKWVLEKDISLMKESGFIDPIIFSIAQDLIKVK